MKLQDVKVTIGGQEVHVSNVEINYEIEGAYPKVNIDGYFAPDYSYMEQPVTYSNKKAEPFNAKELADTIMDISQWQNKGVTMGAYHFTADKDIFIHNIELRDYYKPYIKKEETFMGYSDKEECAKACEDRSYGNLAKKVRDLKLTEDDKLLRKYNVVYDDGVLTNQGKDLLWELLLEDYKETIVDNLKAIEEAEVE